MPERGATDFRFGFACVRSELTLNLRAARAPVEVPDCELRLGVAGDGPHKDARLVREVVAEGGSRPWVRIYEDSAGFVFRFPDIAEFRVTADRRRVAARALAKGTAADLSHLFLHQVLPTLLSTSDLLVVHASAVWTSSGAVAFLGESGQGKSTLAAAFHGRGFAMITDDCLLVRREAAGFRAYGNAAEVRLWQDASAEVIRWDEARINPQVSYTSKRSVKQTTGAEDAAGESGVPIRAIFVLGDEPRAGDCVVTRPVAGQAACMALVKSLFRMSTDGAEEAARLDAIADLVSSVPVCVLEYPRRSELLGEVFAAVARQLDSDAAAGSEISD